MGAMILSAPSVYGPWDCRIAWQRDPNDCNQEDLSAATLADNSVLLAYRTTYGCGPLSPSGEMIGLLWAPSWNSNFERITSDDAPLFGLMTSNEDPYIWRSD